MWDVHVRDGKVELEGTSDTFVSYLVTAHTDLPTYASHHPQIRRRFHDFVFLRRALSHDFTACVVPPLPDKHRMGKPRDSPHKPRETADRSLAPRRVCHRRPLQPRIHRTEAARVSLALSGGIRLLTRRLHPPAVWNGSCREWADIPNCPAPRCFRRSSSRQNGYVNPGVLLSWQASGSIVRWRVTNARQNVFKHKHHARSTSQDESNHGGGVLDTLSDTLLNAFTKLKKADERFVVIRQHLDSFEEGLASLERLAARSKTRMGDLSGDYEDLAVSVQGLGYLESGITDPLMRFERALVDFGANVKDHSALSTELFLEHVHSLLGYSHAFKGVLKLRDQKQLDFEELSAYLSNVVVERDRLANGYGYGMGLGSYFKEKVESLRGGETDMSRAARLQRLDAKIKEVRLLSLFLSLSLVLALLSFFLPGQVLLLRGQAGTLTCGG